MMPSDDTEALALNWANRSHTGFSAVARSRNVQKWCPKNTPTIESSAATSVVISKRASL